MNQFTMEEKNNDFKEYVFDKAGSCFEVITDEIQDRLNLEIAEIIKKQMENIFIMYAKIIEKCNETGIMHGPGRGASAGSLVAYVLEITKINPLEHGLIFERFINPLRDFQPDFDIDFESNRLSEVVEISKEILGEQDAERITSHFLGLHALSKTKTVINEIEKNHNIKIDLGSIPLDDEKTLELFRNADTKDIFLFESDGMKRNLTELHSDSFNDLAAIYSLYRPGLMEYIPQFIEDKINPDRWSGLFSDYSEILDETYGIIVYQEQVMQLITKISGCSLAEADIMRREMGKKKTESVMAAKDIFVNGAVQKGISEEVAEEMFFELMNFSAYAFNKSHSVAYTLISWQQAYLKAHYPVEFEKFAEEWEK